MLDGESGLDSGPRPDKEPGPGKDEWRRRMQAARRTMPDVERHAAQERNGDHVSAALAGLASEMKGRSLTVCVFLPLPSEALPARWPRLLASGNTRVLAPVASRSAPLDWCLLSADGPVTHTGLGIEEPAGPRLGPTAIREADVVVIPALAVDAIGMRLGRGGGHYDRSLALLGPAGQSPSGPDAAEQRAGTASYLRRPWLMAVVFEGEQVAELPHDRHDIPVTHVVSPAAGVRPTRSSRPDEPP